ncbi:fumarylacetoacetate hydrolase family protein [Xanthobacter tagetidis]|uniref:Fumarylacetoacetate hydrolase n=1 Tax=Xanthobacter tagetidis TaxID=60216 RepID=A0A3L7A1I1_9HYPH|nr:fumarylacetoacetate hydrolase family protein [Xanthobacter tagetidis]MBB6307167.1 fumarylacetoacetate (FAA) hydrolase family protein [Xanthobacter tagetidis]RLP74007.1 fumarylacetoacetate hydrolase [Xanthobacter tagetidis]
MTDPALTLDPAAALPKRGLLVGRAFRPGIGPSVVTVRGGEVIDITCSAAPTVRDLCESTDPAALARDLPGVPIGAVADLLANSDEALRGAPSPRLLSPIDLQAVKASGVTFVISLLERVIEEQARGAPDKALAIRADIDRLIGTDLSQLKPGSPAAMEVKEALIARGMWSQYLEVGIGPDAEIFTKGQPLSSVGTGAHVGILPSSVWNNPEPEIAIVVTSRGAIVGATLGNDVNLRDVEGRSALLLGRAKDNNASCSIGPFVRLFDAGFSLDDVRTAELSLTVDGPDGYRLTGASSMRQISRDPEELAAATIGASHHYPDGFVLMLGTMFAPVEDRDRPGEGFTHKVGDAVTIATPSLGALSNRVRHCSDCAPWTFGAADLMRNLAGRGLL